MRRNDPLWLCALLPLGGLLAAEPVPPAGKSPDQDLPAHISRLTLFGERADFSHDGKRLLFLSKTFGDVFELDLASKALRLLTGHYPHHGYTRALYLANGDVLLSGPERLDPEHPGDARVQCYLLVLDKGGTKRPVGLQGAQSGGQRRRPAHGLPDGQVPRRGGGRLRHLPLRLREGRGPSLNGCRDSGSGRRRTDRDPAGSINTRRR